MSAAIMAVWERSREELERRIATLERAVAALLADDLGDALRTSAHSDAHKLAGSLGMFGLAAGSQLAHEVEHKLAGTDALPLSEVPRLAQLVGSLREQFDVHSDGRRAIDGEQHPGHTLDSRAAAHARENRRP
ncbi:MAG: Hpt domain-containing protein [Solirubrobacterales bacterium]|nr:Hpt domain-containing protein [Solirubrobacterales bacterium]